MNPKSMQFTLVLRQGGWNLAVVESGRLMRVEVLPDLQTACEQVARELAGVYMNGTAVDLMITVTTPSEKA